MIQDSFRSILVVCLVTCIGCEDDARLEDVSRIPQAVRIVVNPLLETYEEDQVVTLDCVVTDAAGIILTGFPATWRTPGEELVAPLGQGQFRLLASAEVTWSVHLSDYPDITDTVSLIVKQVPDSVAIRVEPLKDYYRVGEQVRVGYEVLSRKGRVMEDVHVVWQEPDPDLVQPDGDGQYTFLEQGAFAWKVILPAPWGFQDELSLRVDSLGPVMQIDFPARGDTILMETQTAQISVSGQVIDEISGLSQLELVFNGQPKTQVQVEPSGAFVFLAQAEPGLNLVVLQAMDRAGYTTKRTRAFYYSNEFVDLDKERDSLGTVPAMEYALISDRALDRQSSLDPCGLDQDGNYRCETIDDISALLELALNNLDFTSLKPEQEFHFPLVEENFDLIQADFDGDGVPEIEMTVALEGFFDLAVGFSDVSAGLAKVQQLSAIDGGIHADVLYQPYVDAQGVAQAGLNSEVGMTGSLSFLVWLDLAIEDPNAQNLMCAIAFNVCNPDIPDDCLHKYLKACTPVAAPIASIVSGFDTPTLTGLALEHMQMKSDLAIALDPQAPHRPDVTLDKLKVSFGQGAVDVSVLEELEIDLGNLQIFGYEFALPKYTFPKTFLSELADRLVDPIMQALLPLIEPIVSRVFTCNDPDNPMCFVIPFLEKMVEAFAIDVNLELASPFASSQDSPLLGNVHLFTQLTDIQFTAQTGGQLVFSGLAWAEADSVVQQRRDADFLGLPRLAGCLEPNPGFSGHSLGSKSVQLTYALDLTNQILHALWTTGGLDLTLGQENLGPDLDQNISNLSLSLRPYLPILVNHCSPHSMQLQLGDVWVELTYQYQGQDRSHTGFASLAMPIQLSLDAHDQIQVTRLPTTPLFVFEPSPPDIRADAGDLALSQAEALLAETLLPTLLTQFAALTLQQLSHLSPVFDISAFPGIDPSQSTLRIGSTQQVIDASWLIQNGDLVP